MLNHVTLMGRLARDPELRSTNGGVAVASFAIAVDRDRKDANGERKADFFEVTVWRHTADFVSKYFKKGDLIVLNGRLTAEEWTDKEGNKRKTISVTANDVYFGGSKKSDGESRSYAPSVDYSAPSVDYSAPSSSMDAVGGGYSDYTQLEDDDSDVPF